MKTTRYTLRERISLRCHTPEDLTYFRLATLSSVAVVAIWFVSNGMPDWIKIAMGIGAGLQWVLFAWRDPRQSRQINNALSQAKHNETIQQKREERLRRRGR